MGSTSPPSTCTPFPNDFVGKRETPRAVIRAAHADGVNDASFSPDGRFLVTGDRDEIRIWDVASRAPVANPGRPPACTALSHPQWKNATTVFVTCGASAVLFDVLTSTWSETPAVLPNRAKEAPGNSTEVVYLPQGTARWAAEGTKQIRLLDEQWRPVGTLDLPHGEDWRTLTATSVYGRYLRLNAAHDGSALSASTEDEVTVWRAHTGRFSGPGTTYKLPTKKSLGGATALSPNGRWFVYLEGKDWGDRFVLFSLDSPTTPPKRLTLPWRVETPGESGMFSATFTPAGDRLVAATGKGAIAWDVSKGTVAFTVPSSGSVTVAALDPSATLLATETDLGVVGLFDLANGRPKGELGNPVMNAADVEWLSDTELVTKTRVGDMRAIRAAAWRGTPEQFDAIDRSRVRTWSLAQATLTGDVQVPRLEEVHTSGGGIVQLLRTPKRPERCAGFEWTVERRGEKVAACLEQGERISAFGDRALVASSAWNQGAKARRLDLASNASVALPLPECPKYRELDSSILSPRGTYVLGHACSGFHAWNAQGAPVFSAPPANADEYAGASAFSLDERHALLTTNGGRRSPSRISVVELPSWRVVRTIRVDSSAKVEQVRFGATPDIVLILFEDGVIEVNEGGKSTRQIDVGKSTILGTMQVSPSGSRVAVPGPDGGTRIFDVASGRALATLVDFWDGEWILFTPAGAYTGTAEVSERVAWTFTDPPEAFTFEQFAAYADQALTRRRLAGDDVDARPIVGRPPRVEIVGSRAEGGIADISVRASSGRRVDTVRVFVEGVLGAEAHPCSSSGDATLRVPLHAGANHVSVVAYDDRGFASNTRTITLKGETAKSPELWVLAVGIDHYPNLPSAMQLGAAESDARSIAEATRPYVGEGRMYRAMHERTLLGERATARAILSGLEELSSMRPDDVAVILLAGHGFKLGESDEMLFAASGIRLTPDSKALDKGSLAESTVSWSQIASALGRARGRVVLMLDACHSGHVTRELVVPNDSLASKLARSGKAGVVVFAAAKGRQVSYEPGSARGLVLDTSVRTTVRADAHGFFTGAILESLGSPASDRDQDGFIALSELIEDVTRRVRTATHDLQTPWVARREIIGDFALVSAPKK